MEEEKVNEKISSSKSSSSSGGGGGGGGGVPPTVVDENSNDDNKQQQDAMILKPRLTSTSTSSTTTSTTIDWEYYQQLAVLLVGLFCMGSALGFERSLLPRMAVSVFHETSSATIMNFVSAFGAAKAVANILAGPMADQYGRKPTLIFGFVLGLPVMPFVNYASSWTAVTIMNIAFGLSQGLIGSALFFLLIDVMGPTKRGVAVGVGECVIYVSTALINVVAGDLASRYGFRPVPFWVATACSILGLASTIPLKDTLDQVKAEATSRENNDYNHTHDDTNKRISSLPVDRMDSNVSEISAFEGDIIASRRTTTNIPAEPTSSATTTTGKNNDYDFKNLLNEQTPLLARTTGAAITDEESSSSSSSSSSPLIEFDTDSADEMESAISIMEDGTTLNANNFNNNNNNNATTPFCRPRGRPDANVTIARYNSANVTFARYNSDRVILACYRQGDNDGPDNDDDDDNDNDDDDDDDSECGRPMEGMGMDETSSLLEQVLGFLSSQTGINFVILCLGGMALNFKDGFAWGSFPLFFGEYHHLRNDKTDILVAVYPLCWGFSQAFTGALSDLYGRKLFLMAGAMSCTVAMALYTVPGILWGRPAGGTIIDDRGSDGSHRHFIVWVVADVLLGIGTAMSYPSLQAGVADEINPIHRGVGLGVYRFIRDMGYVVGALICGRLTDSIGYMDTFLVVTAVLGSSLLSIIFLYFPVHWSDKLWRVHDHN